MSYRIEKLSEKFVNDVFEIEKNFFGISNSDSIVNSLTSDTLDYFVLLNQNDVIGFFECSIVADEAELFDIAIKEEYQGLGLSKQLMNYFFDYCKTKNVRTIFLEVNITNNKAISLYKKFGFYEYSRRKNYYGDNDAILMKYDF